MSMKSLIVTQVVMTKSTHDIPHQLPFFNKAASDFKEINAQHLTNLKLSVLLGLFPLSPPWPKGSVDIEISRALVADIDHVIEHSSSVDETFLASLAKAKESILEDNPELRQDKTGHNKIPFRVFPLIKQFCHVKTLFQTVLPTMCIICHTLLFKKVDIHRYEYESS